MNRSLDPADSRVGIRGSHVFALLLGVALTLTLRGYQFGGGNHTVYLIEPLREVHPELLANDWGVAADVWISRR